MSIDFRKCLYALSDVVMNRPAPLREFDQIYMKLPDMLLQAELMSRWLEGLRVAFVGDGDAIALTLAHLCRQNLLDKSPKQITVFDFDKRVVNSIERFAEKQEMSDLISAETYNVANAVPDQHVSSFDAFYINPPWGAHNDGKSVEVFLRRAIEFCAGHSTGCIVIGDEPGTPWTHAVQLTVQRFLTERSYRIAEMLPHFHRYHLDDHPNLRSCSLIVQRDFDAQEVLSVDLEEEELANFYGRESPLKVAWIEDLTNGGKGASRDYQAIPLNRVGELK